MTYLGIDIGGTNTKAVLLDEAHTSLASNEVPTAADGSVDSIVHAIESATSSFDLSQAHRCCLALPGIVDDAQGEAVFVPNLGWFERIRIAAAVEELIGVRPRLANDAVCAAVGEAHYGAGKGLASFLMLTLGTAVGAAMIVDGRPLEAYGRYGGELAHIPLRHDGFPCSCGIRGCFQQYGSANALRRIARRAGVPVDTPSDVFALAKTGSESAASAVDRYTTYLAEGIAGLVNIFRPEAVILAGGVAHAGEALRATVEEKLFARTYASKLLGAPQVVIADEPSGAGALGAAVIASQE